MAHSEDTVYEGDTALEHYQVVDMLYDGRPARVLYSGNRRAAQSGLARDDNPDLLFDYNQRFLELVRQLHPRRVLLIGGGVFTLPLALLSTLPDVLIDAVELDPGLTPIATDYFNLPTGDKRLRIYNDDGRHYLATTREVYDVILLDAFAHTKIPRGLASREAAELIHGRLSKRGVAAANVISAYYGQHATTIRHFVAAYRPLFAGVQVFPASHSLLSHWLPQNYVLVAQKGRPRPLELRYRALETLAVSPDDALHDPVQ